MKINSQTIEMEMVNENNFGYVEETFPRTHYLNQSAQVFGEQGLYDSYDNNLSEIEDEDFSKLSLADPNSDSEEFFQNEKEVSPWSKEDNLKKPPKYAVDYRKLSTFNSLVTARTSQMDKQVLEDSTMTDHADRTGENETNNTFVPSTIEASENTTSIVAQETIDEISRDTTNKEIITLEPHTLSIVKICNPPNPEQPHLTKLHWLGVSTFIVAVSAVLALTLFNLYQTAKHG